MNETRPVVQIHSPGETIWTRTEEGTLHVWRVDDEGVPRLTLGDPPFPPPEGQPFRHSIMTQILRVAIFIFGVGSLITILASYGNGYPWLPSFISYSALLMFLLIVLIGISHNHDKHR